jgi:hypothetical protein
MVRQLVASMLVDDRTARVRSVGAVVTLALALAGFCGSSAWAATSGTVANENGVVTATCTSLTITYRNFPNAPNNVVTQSITIHGAAIHLQRADRTELRRHRGASRSRRR